MTIYSAVVPSTRWTNSLFICFPCLAIQGARFALVVVSVVCLGNAQTAPDLSEISLDTLANTEITSVSRKGEKLSQAAAAIFVITSEDIRRSGLTSIPELLRMVPGITVAQVDANNWAITARGFNEVLADKLLVLIDGRTVYDPLSSGVYWDVQDTVVEDIDRIEVIRGPGATLWGANAVNGVVNIITKKAKDTQGTLVHRGRRRSGRRSCCRSLRGRGWRSRLLQNFHEIPEPRFLPASLGAGSFRQLAFVSYRLPDRLGSFCE